MLVSQEPVFPNSTSSYLRERELQARDRYHDLGHADYDVLGQLPEQVDCVGGDHR